MQTEDLIVMYNGPAKLDIEIKSDWAVNMCHVRNEITWIHLLKNPNSATCYK